MLFEDKHLFAFNVLEVSLQNDMGKTILRDYHDEAYAQQI
jgi:hypothetical protein